MAVKYKIEGDELANFQKLEVYKNSQELVAEIYKVTKCYPKEELYGLTNQIRRAVISISANIAEGCGRYHSKDFSQFLRIARASSYEVIALLDASINLKYVSSLEYNNLYMKAEEINKMLNGLMNSLKNKETV